MTDDPALPFGQREVVLPEPLADLRRTFDKQITELRDLRLAKSCPRSAETCRRAEMQCAHLITAAQRHYMHAMARITTHPSVVPADETRTREAVEQYGTALNEQTAVLAAVLEVAHGELETVDTHSTAAA